jgi:hypothetical protein
LFLDNESIVLNNYKYKIFIDVFKAFMGVFVVLNKASEAFEIISSNTKYDEISSIRM